MTTVRLDDLTPAQRRVVLALIATNKAGPAVEKPEPAQEARRAVGKRPKAA